MPQKIEQMEFEETSNDRKLDEKKLRMTVKASHPSVNLQEIIDEGDHLAMVLRRVAAGLHTPKLTMNNALDKWENLIAHLEQD